MRYRDALEAAADRANTAHVLMAVFRENARRKTPWQVEALTTLMHRRTYHVTGGGWELRTIVHPGIQRLGPCCFELDRLDREAEL